VAVVLLGLWLLFHEHVPAPIRAPIATVGGIALLAYGALAAMASVAAGGAFAHPGFGFNLGSAPFSDDITLEQPIASGSVFRVSNASGRTIIHGGSSTSIHVVATRHFAVEGAPPEVTLTPTEDGMSLDLRNSPRPP